MLISIKISLLHCLGVCHETAFSLGLEIYVAKLGLKVKKCEGTSCSFFKTKAQMLEDQEGVFRRIKSLDAPSRINIMELYYKGKMSLLDEVEG